MKNNLFFICLIFLFCQSLEAETKVLELENVLESVGKYYPLIQAAEEQIKISQGEEITALGEFDLNWKTQVEVTRPGYYETQRIKSVISKPTSFMGLDVYGGYREGDGNFAVYDGKYETTPFGEFHVGFNLPLFRNSSIDTRRAMLKIANLGVDISILEKDLNILKTNFKATEKYWAWVAYGLQKSVSEDLLKTAKDRNEGLIKRVEYGEVAEIDLKDNKRTVLQRMSQLASSERIFQQASINLSLFYRDDFGEPKIPLEDQLPELIKYEKNVNLDVNNLVKMAYENRPELKNLLKKKDQVQNELDLSENQFQPRLDLFMELSNDVGDGDRTKEPTELESGIVLEIPLQRRKAQGKIISNNAKLNRLDRELAFYRDSIKTEIQDAISAVRNAQSLIDLIKEELVYAKEVEEGERLKFRAGESNILIVNLRELATAETAQKEIENLAKYKIAKTMLRFSTGKIE